MIEQSAKGLREEIEGIKKKVLEFKTGVSASAPSDLEDRGEVMANITLCYRHLEDAKMRLGKVIEALNLPIQA